MTAQDNQPATPNMVPSVVGVTIRVISTGETGIVTGRNDDGEWLIKLPDGTRRAVNGAEKVRVVPPGWSLEPDPVNDSRDGQENTAS